MALLFTAAAWCTRDRTVRGALLWLIGMALTNLGLFVIYAVCYDYQPQGRYLFPMLAPAAVWMAWAMGRHTSLLKFATPFLLLNGWLLWRSYWLLQSTYAP
ncbi:MAG: hypothetical protein LC725_02690 [Lentisphaerae bacterium]|nr:hypothetical protein [Lentisphaerota bacterium]